MAAVQNSICYDGVTADELDHPCRALGHTEQHISVPFPWVSSQHCPIPGETPLPVGQGKALWAAAMDVTPLPHSHYFLFFTPVLFSICSAGMPSLFPAHGQTCAMGQPWLLGSSWLGIDPNWFPQIHVVQRGSVPPEGQNLLSTCYGSK